MYCENCGTAVNPGSNFCSACGGKIGLGVATRPALRRDFADHHARQSSGKPQIILFITVPAVLLLVITIWLTTSFDNYRGLPAKIREVTFEKSAFANPVALTLPAEDNRKMFDEFSRAKAVKYAVIVQPFGLRDIHGHVLSFLISYGYANAEKITVHRNPGGLMRAFAGSETVGFLFYTKKLAPYILQKSDGWPHGSLQVRGAARKLESVDFTNQYEGSPMGVKIKFHAVNFTYFLEEKLPGLPKISKRFKGEAKAYLDPDSGQWKLERLQLEDTGGDEYVKLISGQYANWHTSGTRSKESVDLNKKTENLWISGLADHLRISGAKLYCASWAPHCREQKQIFGHSAHRFPYIECSPGGPNKPQLAECRGIESYPTWVIGGRRYPGVQSMDALATHSVFKEDRSANKRRFPLHMGHQADGIDAEIKSDLRNAAVAQETFFAQSNVYTIRVGDLGGYNPTPGVVLTVEYADTQRFVLVARKPGGSVSAWTFDSRTGTITPGASAGNINNVSASSTPSVSVSNLRSVESRIRAEMIFENRLREPVLIYWVNYQGQEILYSELNPQGIYSVPSFMTHPWRIRTRRNGQQIKEIVANSPREVVRIE